ncbi:MAG TPA: serine/threonine-protein kinase [Gemmatimonadaceae bacterium]|nr:serine/threonine-protein kinase [Gemmatimonadaceae bacterium]
MATPSELATVATALVAQYVVERELGRGGMGVVYLARDRMLDRLVALKTLPAHIAGDERVRERFLREARTAANLSHPNIVPIHRADEINGVVFFVMGFVDGESLADRVRERGPLPAEEVVGILGDVADALDAAHQRGVVHRDVKAENILLARSTGQAMVTDFGIARVAEAAPMTATGMVLGSVHYMSPEQALGESVDARSDVYSLGVVAFHALSGRFPFENDSASAVVIAHVTRPAPPLASLAPDVPPALAAVVDRCLAKDPAARFDSCRALRAAVDAAMREPRTPAAPDRFSDSEAMRVFDRAARLEQGTRSEVAPLPAPRPAPTASSGYDVETVRNAAREAGIPIEHIDRAIAERTRRSTAVGTLVDRSRPSSFWTGAPLALTYEIAVEGEMSERDFDRVAETIRLTLGETGMVTAVGRSLTWSSTDQNRKTSVSVSVRDGRTVVFVGEKLTSMVGGVFGGIMGGFGGGVGGAVFGAVMSATQGNPAIGLPAWLGVVASSWGIARFTYGRVVRSRRESLRGLGEQIAAEIRDTIAARARRRPLPRPVSSDERERVR